MALKEVEKGPSEDRYWKPAEVGNYAEGYLYRFDKGDYGKQITLYKGYDEDEGEYILQTLPAHADLKRTYVNLEMDVFTRVEVVEIIPPKSKTGNPKFIYKVLQDDEDKMEFPTPIDER
ncbi:hypothetical protein [Methanobrevibacter sp. V14]|uniref:hypothetical protein n=1 Tax=Methanobrevibacter sp. V14 TaxID=3064280 RepID=UPI002734C032|nr:hypothetical protein [Methanobrevibacter sp. V14]